jgi:putative oxidoreductase
MTTFERLYTGWTALLAWLQAPFLLALRLYWGGSFVLAGWAKLMHLAKIADYFSGLGIPFPQANAIAAASVESVGGLCLVLGLFSRIVTVPLLFVLGVAYATAESDALHAIWTEPDKFTGATPFLFAFACLVVLLFGPGLLSLDALLCRRKGGATSL